MALLHHQELLIPSSFGRDMAADLTYTVGNKILAIYAHGINGFKDWGGMNLIAEQFALAGIDFLKFNFSHNGTSLDEPTQFVDLEAFGQDNYSIRQSDLKSVFNFILSNGLPVEAEQMVLIGHSRGGVDAIIYAGEHTHLDALITWAAPNRANTPWANWSDERMSAWEDEGVQYLVNGRTQQKMPLYYQLLKDVQSNPDRYDIERIGSMLDTPWLIIHGAADEAVPSNHAQRLQAASRNAKLQIIPNAGHTFDRTHPWENDALPEAAHSLVQASIDFVKDVIKVER